MSERHEIPIRDRLFLINPDFADPAYPGKRFYCWHCALIEGVLTARPDLARRLDLERVEWQRPRAEVIRWVGEDNQSLPLLLLGAGSTDGLSVQTFGRQRFIADKDMILRALSIRHGFPDPHP